MMTANDTYTAAEAIARLEKAGHSASTFYRWVREGLISKALPAGRVRGALYPRRQIEELIRQGGGVSAQNADEDGPTASEGVTDWIQPGDLPYVLALDYELYGPENYVDISITRSWWEKNPRMCRILFDGVDRRYIWGALTIIPMAEETIYQLLRGDISERDIRPEQIMTYEAGRRYYGYVASAAVRPERRQHFRTL